MDKENQTPPSAEPVQEVKPVRGWHRTALYILIPVVVVLLGVAAYMAMQLKNKSTDLPGVGIAQPPAPTLADTITPPVTQPTPAPDYATGTWINVTWTSPWKPVAKVDCGIGDNTTCDISSTKQYSAGIITDGQYKGQTIYIQQEESIGTYFQYFVKVAGKNTYLYEEGVKIKGIDDAPEYISLPGTSQLLKKTTSNAFLYSGVKKVKKITTIAQFGDVSLTDEGGCFVAALPNGLAVTYSLEVPFVPKDTGIPQISFADGTANKDNYNFIHPTCAALCEWLEFIDEQKLQPSTRLVTVGTAANGEVIYGLKDPNDPVLKDIYKDENTVAYYSDPGSAPDSFQPQGKSKYTYAQFLALHPLLYWKDALGRWVQFRNARVAVAAEMCKPVIYLYPTKDTNLKIEVAPNGGLTKTIPEYGNGWEVTAHPTGKITDRKTGQIYDYLFWEGIGMQYPNPTEGFVVATKDLSTFFDATLPKLGLVGKEIVDFKEYWVARLQNTGKPYALVSFMDPLDFAALAPVAITGQQPTSTIRVMMTAKALDEKISIPKQKLPPTPIRKGFIYAEWGGALLQ